MKSNAFILDFNLLKEQGIEPEDFVLLIQINNNLPIDNSVGNICLNSLQNNLFIRIENNDIIIREKGRLLLELTTIDSVNYQSNKAIIKKSSRAINSELTNEFINTYRQLWKGLKLGSMGSESACKAKLTRWMLENPSYTSNDILKAAKIYIDSLVDYRFLQTADYFIFKKDGKEESSRLSAFIDEIDNEEIKDWTTNLS
jgi:hypothetical protein